MQLSPDTSDTAPLGFSRQPQIRITARPGPLAPQLADLWAHRELLYFLIWRDLKVRYRQTFLGVVWVVLQPLLMTLVFTIFFSKLGHFVSEGVPYPLFAYAGLLPWTFFSNSVSAGSSSLLGNSYIITKVYFPRLLIPTAMVGVRLMDFLIACGVLLLLMPFYGVGLSRSMIFVPLIILASTLLSVAVGAWFSVLNVKYRDVGTLLPVLIQVWMFMSPIIYPVSIIPARWRFIYSLNPLVGIVSGFRSCFFGLPFDWSAMIVSAIIIIALFGYVLFVFYRSQETLIDRL